MWYVVPFPFYHLLIPSKIMRPGGLPDMGVTIPDMFGKSIHSLNLLEDAKFLCIIDQAYFLLMRRRGRHEALVFFPRG
jgi:hypothetical protein